MPHVEELAQKETRADNLKIIYDRMNKELKLDAEKDKDLIAIQSFLANPANRKDKQATAEKMLFDYIVENKRKFTIPEERKKVELCLGGLGGINSLLASSLENILNKDPSVGGYIKDNKRVAAKLNVTIPDRPIRYSQIIAESGIKPGMMTNNRLIRDEAKKNPKLQNLEKLYARLTSKDVNHLFRSNTPEYEEMVKSIKETIDYAKLAGNLGASQEVMEEMYKKVAEKTNDYIDKKPLRPDTPSGKARQELALAVLLVADKAKGEKKIDDMATRLKAIDDQKVHNIETMFGPGMTRFDKSHFLSVDKVVENTKIDVRYSKAEKLEGLNKVVNDFKNGAYRAEGFGKNDYIGQYIIAKTNYEKIARMKEQDALDFKLPSSTELVAQKEALINSPQYKAAYNDVAFDGDRTKYGQLTTKLVDADKILEKFRSYIVGKDMDLPEKEVAPEVKNQAEMQANKPEKISFGGFRP